MTTIHPHRFDEATLNLLDYETLARYSRYSMGVFDIYCAICAAPFTLPHPRPCSDQHISTTWLHDLRILAKDAYVTSVGTAGPFGQALVEGGILSCYFDWSAMGSGNDGSGFPVHARCLEVLEGMIGEGVEWGVLRGVMEGLQGGGANCLGGMEYFECQPEMGEEVWESEEGTRKRALFLADPGEKLEVEVPLVDQSPKSRTPARIRDRSPDTLDALPTELILQTLDQLSSHDFLDLWSASPSVRARCDARFWRNRFCLDMPYLRDIFMQASLIESSQTRQVDWEKLYRQMLAQSYPSSAKVTKPVLGVASRRRIWQCVDQLLDSYAQKLQQRRKPQEAPRRPSNLSLPSRL